jgi:hypothetical protein
MNQTFWQGCIEKQTTVPLSTIEAALKEMVWNLMYPPGLPIHSITPLSQSSREQRRAVMSQWPTREYCCTQ